MPRAPAVTFRGWMTLGGWLGGGIAWHLSACGCFSPMALPISAYGFSLATSVVTFYPSAKDHTPRSDDALQFRLATSSAPTRRAAPASIWECHRDLSGGPYRTLDWKPVQLGWLTGLFGGYPVARTIHLTMMALMSAFSSYTWRCHIVPPHARFDARPVRSELDSAPRGACDEPKTRCCACQRHASEWCSWAAGAF